MAAAAAETDSLFLVERTMLPPVFTVETTESHGKVVARVQEVAAARGAPPARIALAWLLQKPGITALIIGASKPQHFEDAVAAFFKLSAEEFKALEEPYVPHPVVGHQ